MSRKHNTKHNGRGTSNYPARLSARGLAKSPELESLEDLQKRQLRRVHETCTVGDNHNGHECNGNPWWVASADDTPEEALLREIFTAENAA